MTSRSVVLPSRGISLELMPLEFTLLSKLFNSTGQVFLRRKLLDTLYSIGELVADRVIEVHLEKLRQQIGEDPDTPTYIHTVRGTGYRFCVVCCYLKINEIDL